MTGAPAVSLCCTPAAAPDTLDQLGTLSLLPGWITATDFGPHAFRDWRTRAAELWVVRFRLLAVANADLAAEALAEAHAAQPTA